MRSDFGQQLLDGNDVALRHRQLLNFPTLIEGQVEEMDVTAVDAIIGTGQSGLATADQSLKPQHRLIVQTALLFILEELFYCLVTMLDHFVASVGKDSVEAVDKVHETRDLLVTDGDIATGLISNMHVVSLLHQSPDSAAHGDDVVIRMG